MRGRIILVAAACGLLFSAGLTIGGMTDPGKVSAFLDVTRDWDPSLAFVMGGAIAVFAPVYWLSRRRLASLLGAPFPSPPQSIDARLILGAVLFGAGWGLAGYCPGPAITASMSLGTDVLVVLVSMLVGMAAFRMWEGRG